jgi:hypothetical protein
MPRILTPALSLEEWTSLHEVSRSLPPPVIAEERRRRLIYLGYITDSRGVLAVTKHGRERLAARVMDQFE